MHRINHDIDERSFWLFTTPSPAQLSMPYYCTEAGTIYGRKDFLTERTGKDSYILFFTFGGAGFVRQGGHRVFVRHGQALLMDCRTPQAYGTAPNYDHWYHLWAHIDGSGVAAHARRMGLPALATYDLAASRMHPHFETIFARLAQDDVESSERVGLAVHSLLSELLIATTRTQMPTNNPVELAQAFVATHLADHISVGDMAAAANVSDSMLTKLFRKQLATSPHDYLIRQRITHAKQLLMETDLPIGAIARQSGFQSESNFSYRFAKVCDVSPRAYRGLREHD